MYTSVVKSYLVKFQDIFLLNSLTIPSLSLFFFFQFMGLLTSPLPEAQLCQPCVSLFRLSGPVIIAKQTTDPMSTWLATLRASSRHLTQISSPWNRKLGPREFINYLNLNGLDVSSQNVVPEALSWSL